MFGIRPGETPLKTAFALRYHVSLQAFTYAGATLTYVGPGGVWLKIEPVTGPDLPVQTIVLSEFARSAGARTSTSPILQQRLAVGDILSQFGSPAAVKYVGDRMYLLLQTRPVIVVGFDTSSADRYIRPETPISTLALFSKDCQRAVDNVFTAWHGFTTFGRYSLVASLSLQAVSNPTITDLPFIVIRPSYYPVGPVIIGCVTVNKHS
jgi:hypothetical protein